MRYLGNPPEINMFIYNKCYTNICVYWDLCGKNVTRGGGKRDLLQSA